MGLLINDGLFEAKALMLLSKRKYKNKKLFNRSSVSERDSFGKSHNQCPKLQKS